MRKFLFLVIPLILSNCVSTNISSFQNPDIDFSQYKKIAVYGNIRDISFRKMLETDFTAAFTNQSINAIATSSIISPLKEYTNQEFFDLLSENAVDGLLSIEVISANRENGYVPLTTSTYYQSYYSVGQLNLAPFTTTSGGYVYSYPKASFEITLTDVKTGEIAFRSTANSRGDEFSDMKTISESIAENVVEEYKTLSGK